MAIHDRGWVPADPDAVHAVFADVARYPAWWTGAAVEDGPASFALKIDGLGRTRATPMHERPGMGLVMRLSGPVDGVLEWYLQPMKEGTLVNALLRLYARPRRWSRRREVAYRSAVRRALVGLRKLLEDRPSS